MTQIPGEDFTEIFNNVANRSVANGKHLRFRESMGLYINTKVLSFEKLWDWFECLRDFGRARRRAAGPKIWQAIANQHDEETANEVFRSVLGCEEGQRRVEIDWQQMKLINEKLQESRPQGSTPAKVKPDAKETLFREPGIFIEEGAPPPLSLGEVNQLRRHALHVAESKSPALLESFLRENLFTQITDRTLAAVDSTLPTEPVNVQKSFRRVLAWCYYKSLARVDVTDRNELVVPASYVSIRLVKLLGVNVDTRDISSATTTLTSLENPDESAKRWMLDQIYLSLYGDKVDSKTGKVIEARDRDYGETTLGGYQATHNSTAELKYGWFKAEEVSNDEIVAIANAFDFALTHTQVTAPTV